MLSPNNGKMHMLSRHGLVKVSLHWSRVSRILVSRCLWRIMFPSFSELKGSVVSKSCQSWTDAITLWCLFWSVVDERFLIILKSCSCWV